MKLETLQDVQELLSKSDFDVQKYDLRSTLKAETYRGTINDFQQIKIENFLIYQNSQMKIIYHQGYLLAVYPDEIFYSKEYKLKILEGK